MSETRGIPAHPARVTSALARSSAPVAIGTVAVAIAADAVRYIGGRLTGRQFVERGRTHAVTGGCTFAGAEAGARLGTMLVPGVGTIVGGLAGALLAGWFAAWAAA